MADYLDLRAEIQSDTQSWADVLLVWLPAIGGVLTSLEEGTKLIPLLHVPLIGRVVLLIMATVGLVVVVCRRMKVAGVGFAGSELKYRYFSPQGRRTTAKVVLPLVLTLAVLEVPAATPNWMCQRRVVGLYVCSKGSPQLFQGVTVTLVDGFGKDASDSETADSHGFAYLKLHPWTFKPIAARLSGNSCRTGMVDLSSSIRTDRGCPLSLAPVRQASDGLLLEVSCVPQK